VSPVTEDKKISRLPSSLKTKGKRFLAISLTSRDFVEKCEIPRFIYTENTARNWSILNPYIQQIIQSEVM